MLKYPQRRTILASATAAATGFLVACFSRTAIAGTPGSEYPILPQEAEVAASFSELGQAAHVMEGASKSPKSILYIFVDANCPFCHLTWKALQPYEATGLQVRWIPVALLRPSSLPKAIDILSASNTAAAFRETEVSFGKQWPLSSHLSASDKAKVAARIRKNGELMAAFGLSATPGIVWKDSAGYIKVKVGMPHLREIPQMTGLPEQPISDTELARFR